MALVGFLGYVQMAGIMDESMDEEELKNRLSLIVSPKPAWQRLIILLGESLLTFY